LAGGPDLDVPLTPPEQMLSPRLRQTLSGLLAGNSEKQVAATLGLSKHTVHLYVTAIYRHFGVNSRGELLALLLRGGGRRAGANGAVDAEDRGYVG
jgi:DNA-binding NarL/FixJ family response regulator